MNTSRRMPQMKCISAVIASCFAAAAFANPVGPSVVSGTAGFAATGQTLTVTNSPNAIINWQGFSIGVGETTRFVQQSAASAVLNRVVGQDPSAILGTLSSNGHVYLVNPNGILFGQGSRVDVAGLVATTLNITNNDFLAGRLNFEAGAIANPLVNQGDIVTASGGRVLLLAPDVQNHGLISSPQGEVVLAAGKSVQLVEADLPQLKVEVQAGGEALNVGRILAEGGKIGVYAGLINQRGIVRADSASVDATGRIVFRSSDTTLLEEGSVTAATGARGGEIQVLGDKVGLTGNALVDASGDTGGGTVLVGGDFQGKNPEVQNAFRAYFGPEATIKADAITSGDGGRVIVWSDDATRAYGTISARGGAQGGDGGFVEVSGKRWLDFAASVDTSATKGATGTLLLDPSDVDIVDGSDSLASGAGFDDGNPNIFDGGSGSSVISWQTISDHLTTTNGGTNVIITTSGTQCSSGDGCGDITVVNSSPVLSSSNDLWLVAHRDIHVNGSITNFGGGELRLYAGWSDGAFTYPTAPTLTAGTGTINVNQNIGFNGDVALFAGKDINVTSADITSSNANVSLTASGSIAINNGLIHSDISGGSVNLTGASISLVNSKGPSKGISVNGAEGNATISLTATNGITVSNSDIDARGDSSGGAISMTGGGKITVESNSLIRARGWGTNTVSIQAQAAQQDALEVSGSEIRAGDNLNESDASVSLVATNGGIRINGSNIYGLGGASSGGTATIQLQALQDIWVTGGEMRVFTAFNSGSPNTVSLHSTGGNVLVDGGAVLTADAEERNTTMTLQAAGTVKVEGASVVEAISGGDATVVLTGPGGIEVNGNSIVNAEASGAASIQVTASGAGANVSIGGSTLQAGPLSESGTSASIEITANGAILDPLGTSILRAGQDSSAGAITLSAQSGIGDPDKPIRIDGDPFGLGNAPSVVADNTGATGSVALLQTSQNISVGASGPNGTYGTYTVTNSASGAIDIGTAGGTLLLPSPISFSHSGAVAFRASGTVDIQSGASVAGAGVTLQGDDLAIGGSVNGGSGPVILKPYTASRQINIESSPSGGVLSLTPTEIQNVTTTGTLEIGRSDSNAPLLVNAALTNTNINASTLRLYGGSVELASGGVDIFGTSGTPFDRHLELIANDNVQLLAGVYLSNNRNLTVIADNDSSGFGSINIGGNTVRVGTDGSNTTGSMSLSAHEMTIAVAGNGTGLVQVTGSGSQSLTAAGDIDIQNSNPNSGSLSVQTISGAQTITAGGTLTISGSISTIGANTNTAVSSGGTQTVTAATIEISGGEGSNSFAEIVQTGSSGAQTITATGALTLTAGGNLATGTLNHAQIRQSGSGLQHVTANSIFLEAGGAGGGATGTNNRAAIFTNTGSTASQMVEIGSGGLTMLGGSGSGGENKAGIWMLADISGSGTNATQTVMVSGGGSISVTGGDNGTNTPGGSNNSASIAAYATGAGGSQTVTVTGTGSINLTGGGSGIGNHGSIWSETTSQSITVGSGGITLQGDGGTSGRGNPGLILQDYSAGSQTITVGAGGDITLTGGSGDGGFNAGQILSNGTGLQWIGFTDPGSSITLHGGTGDILLSATSGNSASIDATAGNQTIEGTVAGNNPNITVMGGDSGGNVFGSASFFLGNSGLIRSRVGTQTISAGALQVKAGIGGVDNSATIQAPNQIITASSVSLLGGADTGSFAGARIGGIGGASPGPTNLSLTTTGDVSISGGSGSGASIGANSIGGVTTTIALDVGGNLILEGNGTVARIGSPSSSPAGGNISINVGGNVTFTDRAYIRTLGDLMLDAVGTLSLTGGASGSGIQSFIQTGNQDISALGINLSGGDDGLGNSAYLLSTGTQTISAGANGISLTGGGGTQTDNTAFIYQSGTAGTSQVISVAGNVMLQGGSSQLVDVGGAGHGSRVFIQADGDSQTIDFTAPGSTLTLQGGSVGSRNFATINAINGTQTISGAPAITVRGGPSGGFDIVTDTEGNFARIAALSGLQAIEAASITLEAGAGGIENFAVIEAPIQDIIVLGNLTLTGGGSMPGVFAGAGARIGGHGGAFASATNLLLDVGGNVSLSGGSTAGSSIGNAPTASPFATNIELTVGGNVTLTGGTGAGSRIGSAAVNDAGGTVSVTADGDIVLGSNTLGFGTAIRTTGDLILDANAITQNTGSAIVSGGIAAISTLAGSTLAGTSSFGTLALVSGDVALSGTLTTGTPLVIPDGITLSGTGTVIGDVINEGTVAPGSSAGILTIDGDYTQTSGGVLTVEIGGTTPGTEYDRLAVSGTATLDGTLNVVEGTVAPVAGTTYEVLTYASRSGTFATVNHPTLNVTPTYGATGFTLPFVSFLNLWGGGASAAWEDPANWGRGVVPGASDDVVIDAPGTVTVTISSGTQAARSLITNENLTLSGGSLNLAAPSTVNGTFTLSGGTLAGTGSLTLNGNFDWTSGTMSNTGGLITTGTSTISGTGAKSITSLWTNTGTINLLSSVTASGGLQLTGGLLMGNGVIVGNVNNSGGTVSPGASPGHLTIDGDYTQGPGGTLLVEIGESHIPGEIAIAGLDYDWLEVTGTASLGGTLDVQSTATAPIPGSTYTVITCGTCTGQFSTVNALDTVFTSAVAGYLPASVGVSVTSTSVAQGGTVSQTTGEVINQTTDSQLFEDPLLQENEEIQALSPGSGTTDGENELDKQPPPCS